MKSNIEKNLHSLQEIRASVSLKKRIEDTTLSLPSSRIGFNYPLIAFRFALASVILFFVVGVSSGVVVAAKGSNSTSVLFPLKKAIVETQIHFAGSESEKVTLRAQIQEKLAPTGRPTTSPTPTPAKHTNGDKREKEVEGISHLRKNNNSQISHPIVTPRPTGFFHIEQNFELDK